MKLPQTCFYCYMALFLHALPRFQPMTDSDESFDSEAERMSRASNTFLFVLCIVAAVDVSRLKPLQLNAEQVGKGLKNYANLLLIYGSLQQMQIK